MKCSYCEQSLNQDDNFQYLHHKYVCPDRHFSKAFEYLKLLRDQKQITDQQLYLLMKSFKYQLTQTYSKETIQKSKFLKSNVNDQQQQQKNVLNNNSSDLILDQCQNKSFEIQIFDWSQSSIKQQRQFNNIEEKIEFSTLEALMEKLNCSDSAIRIENKTKVKQENPLNNQTISSKQKKKKNNKQQTTITKKNQLQKKEEVTQSIAQPNSTKKSKKEQKLTTKHQIE